MSDTLTDDHVNWTQQFTGVDLGAGGQSADPIADQADQPADPIVNGQTDSATTDATADQPSQPADPNVNGQADSATTDPTADQPSQPADQNADGQIVNASTSGQSIDPPADQTQPSLNVSLAAGVSDAPGDAPPQLVLPQLGTPDPGQNGLPPNLQLHFTLSDSELAACNQYLGSHFDAVLTAGASPAILDSYQPGLDGQACSIADAVHVLLPLTTAAMSKDGSDQIYQDAFSQLYSLVQTRFSGLALGKSKAVMDAATKKATGDVAAAAIEVDAWLKTYLQGNGLAPDPRDDGSNKTVIFDDKPMQFATVVSTAVAAGGLANLQSGDLGRTLITPDRVSRIITDMIGPSSPAAPSKPDEGPEVSVETDPSKGTTETQVQYTVKLKATNDENPPRVQIFPDAEITVHMGPDGKSPSIEGQINAVKADIGRMLHIGGKIKIDATVGLSAETDVADAAAVKIARSLEGKIKAELEITVTKNLSIKPGLEEGPDGKPKGGLGLVWKF